MNTTLWNCLIQAYTKLDVVRAIKVIDEMREHIIEPDATTFGILITACANEELPSHGNMLCDLARSSLKDIPIELSTSIINFYTKCGEAEMAIEECEKLKQKGKMDVVTWTCLIQAHLQRTNNHQTFENHHGLERAFEVYEEMKQFSVPDHFTYLVLLSACGEVMASHLGTKLIEEIKSKRMNHREDIISSMIYFYSRIGKIEIAKQIFYDLFRRNRFLSTSTFANILSCYASHGKGQEAKELFKEMLECRVELNEIIFITLLNSYSQCGMIQDAIELNHDMIEKHNFKSTLATDCAMVDVYAR